jgi:hypothetical protein
MMFDPVGVLESSERRIEDEDEEEDEHEPPCPSRNILRDATYCESTGHVPSATRGGVRP